MERKLKFPSVCDAEDIVGQMPGGELKTWKQNCLLASVEKEQRKVGHGGRASQCWLGEAKVSCSQVKGDYNTAFTMLWSTLGSSWIFHDQNSASPNALFFCDVQKL